jgi:hypothetical protein
MIYAYSNLYEFKYTLIKKQIKNGCFKNIRLTKLSILTI